MRLPEGMEVTRPTRASSDLLLVYGGYGGVDVTDDWGVGEAAVIEGQRSRGGRRRG